MLFSAKYIEKNLKDFQDLAEYFFRQLETNSHQVFSDELFPAGQRARLHKRKNTANEHKKFVDVFKAIFDLYTSRTFSKVNKQKLIDDYFASNAIDGICNDVTLHPKHYDELDPRVQKVATLYNQLYDPYFKDIVDKKEHSIEHQTQNGKICPICGMNTTYPYDHFLPRGKDRPIYPFSCVNPKNLLPICQDCNGPKSSKLIIYRNNNRNNGRSLAFSPYCGFDTWENVDFKLTNIKKPSVSSGGKWTVSFTIKNQNLDADKLSKIDTWRVFYKIEERFANEIAKFTKSWVKEYQEKGKTLDEMIIETQPDEFNIRRINSVLLQNLLFRYLNTDDEIRELLSPAMRTAQDPSELLQLRGIE